MKKNYLKEKLEIKKMILDMEIKKRRELKRKLVILNRMIDSRREQIKEIKKEIAALEFINILQKGAKK